MKRTTQGGYMLMAFVAILLMIVAVTLATRSNRLVVTSAAVPPSQQSLTTLLEIVKQQIAKLGALQDNTPGTLPCPNSKPSCSATSTALAGLAPSGVNLDEAAKIAGLSTTNLCVQYVLAPSLRNFLHNSIRGSDPAQKVINPEFDPDLAYLDKNGRSVKAWVVLLARADTTDCSLSALGHQLNVDTNGIATLVAIGEASTTTVATTLQSRDMVPLLYSQVLENLSPLDNYLTEKKYSGILSSARKIDPISFDEALAHTENTALLLDVKTGCNSIVSADGSNKTDKEPVSWLCFNAWYDYLSFDAATGTFSLHDPATSLRCSLTPKASENTSCSY